MQCPICGGKGYREEQHGLIQIGCPECKATGIVGDVIFTGLQFQLAGQNIDGYSIDDLWVMAKEEAVANMEFPQIAIMPCGNTQTFSDSSAILNLPIKDIPCPCGNPNHAIVRFIEVIDKGLTEAEIDFAESQIFPESIDARAVVIDVNKAETQGSPIEVNDDNYWQDTEEVKDDNRDGTEQPDTVTRSRNTRKPTKSKKPKTKKTARSKAG